MIGLIGGTGPEGRGLALRFGLAGERMLIGSRDVDRAREAAASVQSVAPAVSVSGKLNADAALEADMSFVTVPYAAHRRTLEELRDRLVGKIVVDPVAPLELSKRVARAVPVPEGSAALEAQAILPSSTVVAAFHTISSHDLLIPGKCIDCDVIVCSDDPEARDKVMALAERINGIRAINGGGLENAVNVENLTPLLMNINRLYTSRAAIRIVGI